MPDHETDPRPTLLMLSHCVPDAVGTVDRVRAWQLLKLASQSHRVHLACLMDRPVQLAQWRAIHALADRLVIERKAPWRAIAARCVRTWHGPAGDELAVGEALRASVDVWLDERPYDALVCTHPLMWRCVRDVPADVRICDVRLPASLAHLRRLREAGAHQRWWHEQQARLFDATEQAAAGQFDVLTVGHTAIEHKFITARCETVVLPDALDLAHYPRPRMSEAAAGATGQGLDVLVYADHARGSGRAADRRFARHIWPRVRRAVPSAKLTHCDASASDAVLPALGRACIIVCPESDPALARLPMLQAMAGGGALVADRRAAQDLGARHGEHVLGGEHDRDWAELCIHALRDASMRLQLACGGRGFAEQRGRIEQSGAGLRQRLETMRTSPILTPEPLRKAA